MQMKSDYIFFNNNNVVSLVNTYIKSVICKLRSSKFPTPLRSEKLRSFVQTYMYVSN